jgi:hypothetical protein
VHREAWLWSSGYTSFTGYRKTDIRSPSSIKQITCVTGILRSQCKECRTNRNGLRKDADSAGGKWLDFVTDSDLFASCSGCTPLGSPYEERSKCSRMLFRCSRGEQAVPSKPVNSSLRNLDQSQLRISSTSVFPRVAGELLVSELPVSMKLCFRGTYTDKLVNFPPIFDS